MTDLPVFASLSERLHSFGDIAELRLGVDLGLFAAEVRQFDDAWKVYNPSKPYNRYGLSITSLDGEMTGVPDLTSISEHNAQHGTTLTELDFNVPTDAFRKITSLHRVLNHFQPLGRTHVIRLDQGGFFPPHRDSLHKRGMPKTYRVLVPLLNTMTNDWVFMYEDRAVRFQRGTAYFINTLKAHSVFSFVNGCMMLVVNVPFTQEGVGKVIDAFAVR